jgi:hypothetical protein
MCVCVCAPVLLHLEGRPRVTQSQLMTMLRRLTTQDAAAGGGTARVRFLDAGETFAYIAADGDGYARGLSIQDLRARGCTGADEYLALAAPAARDFDERTRARLEAACGRVDRAVAGAALRGQVAALAVAPDRLAALPWVLACTRGRAYENGYPHTRGNVIFLSDAATLAGNDDGELARTLLHEKVHVYQRLHRVAFAKGLHALGYRALPGVSRRAIFRARANPDLDDAVYVAPDDSIMLALYRSDSPASISDVMLTAAGEGAEHPNEAVAYRIAALLGEEGMGEGRAAR